MTSSNRPGAARHHPGSSGLPSLYKEGKALAWALLACFFLGMPQAQAAAQPARVGNIIFVFGDATIAGPGGTRVARKGDAINEGETLVTQRNASVQVKMIDEGFIAVRPDTNMKFDEYRYAGREDGNERGLLSVVHGGFRTITGVIGRLNKQNYMVTTPTATIGIRGTDHEVIHIPTPPPGQLAIGSPGSYDKVNVGGAFIRTAVATVNVNANQVGYAPSPNQPPQLLPRIPEFFRSTPPPPPRTAQQQQQAQASEPVRESAVVDSPQQMAAVVADASAASTLGTATGGSAQSSTGETAATSTVQQSSTEVVLTSSTGETLDVTANTVTSSTGTVVPVTQAAIAPAVVNFPDNTRVRHTGMWTTSPTGLNDSYFVGIFNNLDLTNPVSSTLTGPTVNTNYLFNFAGNLVEVLNTPYAIFDKSQNLAPGAGGFATPTVISNADVVFGGGGSLAAEVYSLVGGSPDPILRMGRWQGGNVSVKDLSSSTTFIDSLISPLGGGSRSVHWLVRQGVPVIPTTGHFHYTRVSDATGAFSLATAPTDSYGNVGTLNGARLTVDFLQSRVSAGVRVAILSGPGGSFGLQNLSGNFADAPLQGGGFSVSSNPAQNPANTDNFRVTCLGIGCAPNQTPSGRISGAFAGLSAEAGFFRYTFTENYPDAATAAANGGRTMDDYVQGLVGFAQGPAIVTPPAGPTGPSNVLTTYSFGAGPKSPDHFEVNNPSLLLLDAQGNLQAVTDEDEFNSADADSLSLSGGTINNNGSGSTAPIVAANGITLGWRSASPALTLTGQDFQDCFGTVGCTNPARTANAEGLAWVRGPAIYPWYLPSAISTISNSGGTVVSGSRSFTFSAATLPRDQNGIAGTLSSSSTLSVDFNKQSVAFGLNATTPAGAWVASASDIGLDDGGSFHANTGSGETTLPAGINTHRQMTVTLTGCTPPSCSTFGNVNGRLMGAGVDGAGMAYSLGAGTGTGGNRVSGAVAFSNPQPYSIDTPYRLFGLVSGMNALGGSVMVGGFPASFEEENTRIMGGAMARSRVETDANGMPLKLDANFPVASVFPGCISPCKVNSHDISVVYAVAGATGVASVGTATLQESGRDLDTGVVWGRYGGVGSTIGVTDRLLSSVSLGTIDATQHAHFIMSANQSGPTVLPVSGTFNYALIGNTLPTDNLGNVGTLNSAALSANFTAKTVNASVGVTVAGSTWSASAAGMPIQQGTFFQAERNFDGTGNLAVTRNGAATSTRGEMVGAFTGQTGRGAALMYSINQGGHSSATPVPGTTVSGVAAFKR